MMLTTTSVDEGMSAPFADAIRRVRAEFLEMPGLRLTISQAARLWAMDIDLCEAVLATLVETRFLVRTSKAQFARASNT